MNKDVGLGEEEVCLVRAECIVEVGVLDRGADDLDEIVRLREKGRVSGDLSPEE